uniref:Uncharacterized protein n=1 Tax=Aegilops tauschii subsp. strangulata TaxID=200361 RepID=A0A453F4R1_AEGTS
YDIPTDMYEYTDETRIYMSSFSRFVTLDGNWKHHSPWLKSQWSDYRSQAVDELFLLIFQSSGYGSFPLCKN